MMSSLVVSGGEKGLRAWLGQIKHLLTGHHAVVQMDEEPGIFLRRFQLLDLEEHNEDPVQEWGEEVEDGAIYGVTLHREPIQSPSEAPSENNSALGFIQYRTLKVRRLKAASLERLVTELVNPDCPEPDYAEIFLSTYRAFTTTSNLIELLFEREDAVSNLNNSVCGRSALPGLIRLWLDEHQEDFRDSPEHLDLRLLCVHLRHHLCFRRLLHQAEGLLKRFQAEEDGTQKAESEEICDVLAFPTRDLAEQLTRLDAELFVKVVPYHCLGSIWSQRDKKENLAPTVRATITQFNTVANSVITSLLCPPDSCPLDSPSCLCSSATLRAKIIEKWILVAQECHALKNFSSLRAILSALQSNAVYRLKKTWAEISREHMAAFEQLCDTFPDENCVLINREILVEDGNQATEDDVHCETKSPKIKPKHMTSGGEVPYLGTYLTVLTMLDTALSDNVEGGLINFEKRRKEFEILSEIRQLQASCAQYTFKSQPHITAWIHRAIPFSDQKSYELSRELEPPVDPCPNSPNPWSHKLFTKKLTSLLSGSDNLTKKTHADQISVSSSGSSGSEMEDLCSPNHSPFRYKFPSVSCQDISVETPTSSRSLSQADVSSLNSDNPSPASSSSSSPHYHPMYNKQVADTCIVRVSVEFGNNGNVYKSILVTSQDKTAAVIQRVLEKHNLEQMNDQDFTLSQVISHEKEVLIPDKANVFYAMCTTANYDFVLRQRYKGQRTAPCPSWSPGAVQRGRR